MELRGGVQRRSSDRSSVGVQRGSSVKAKLSGGMEKKLSQS